MDSFSITFFSKLRGFLPRVYGLGAISGLWNAYMGYGIIKLRTMGYGLYMGVLAIWLMGYMIMHYGLYGYMIMG
jgi:hypothetical protein